MIKKFNELFDKTNEEIVYQPTTDVDRNNPPTDDEKFYTEEDMEKCWMSARRKTYDTGIPLNNSFDEWIQNYNSNK